MSGLLNGKQLKDGTVTPVKLSERYLRVNEKGEVTGDLVVNGNTILSEKATYKHSEIATHADLDELATLQEKETEELTKQIEAERERAIDAETTLKEDIGKLEADILAELKDTVVDVNYKEEEAVLTFTFKDESTKDIILPKENFLSAASFDPDTYILTLTLVNDVTFDVDMTELVDIYTAGNGLQVSQNQFSVVIDRDSDSFLSVSLNGVKLSGVTDALNKKADKTDVYAKSETNVLLNTKQDTLQEGSNIKITGNVISATDTIYNDSAIKASISGLETEVAKKANQTDVYTKTEVDQKIGNITIDTSMFVNLTGVQTITGTKTFGTVNATSFVGNLSGNASTATKLATARTISLTGGVTGSGNFDGSGNLTINTTVAGSSSANQLTTPRTLWGQSFNGTANVSGSLSNTGDIIPAANESFSIGSYSSRYDTIYAYKGVFNTSVSTLQVYTSTIGASNNYLVCESNFSPHNTLQFKNLGTPGAQWNIGYIYQVNCTVLNQDSDKRLKNIGNKFNEYVLDNIMKLTPTYFTYKERSERTHIGYIAQEVQEIFPELITVDESTEEKYLGMDYLTLGSVIAVKGLQELKTEVDILKERIAKLEAN